MEPDSVISLKILSDPFLTSEWVYFTTNWVEDNRNVSIISKFDGIRVLNVTHSKHERCPFIYDKNLFYINVTDEAEELVQVKSEIETSIIQTFKKIIKYKVTSEGIIVIGERIINKDSNNYFITKKLKYRADGRGLLKTRRKLYLVTFEGQIKEIIGGEYDIIDFDVNKKEIIFSASMECDDMDLALQEVYILNLETSSLKRVTEGKGEAHLVSMDLAGHTAYVGHREGKSLATPNRLMFPSENKCIRVGNDIDLVFTDLNPSSSNHLIYDNGCFYTIGEEGGKNSLYCFDGTSVQILTDPQLCIRDFSVSSGKICYVYSNFKNPNAIVFNGKTYNPNSGFIGTDAELHTLNGIEFWLMTNSKSAPTILYIHGGPHNAFGNSYFGEFDFMYKNGFNIVFANPTGSKGYGEEFAKSCIGDWAGKDYEELMDIIKYLREEVGFIDLFHVTGLSYGGFMTCAIITKTKLFRSAITEAPVTNLVSMCGTSDIGFWFNSMESNVEDPWCHEGMLKLLKMSPIFNVRNIETPLMFIHGESDYRCPIEQSEQLYTALLIKGVETQFMRIMNEPHAYLRVGNPEIKTKRLELKLEWFKRHSIRQQ